MRGVALLRADCCRIRCSNDLFNLLPTLFSLVQTRQVRWVRPLRKKGSLCKANLFFYNIHVHITWN